MSGATNLTLTTPSDTEIVMRRMFDAPRRLVFKAMVEPELLKRWLTGPPGWAMVACEIDFRVGGSFRHVWRHDDGNEMSMCGVYREIVPPERIVRTETFAFGCDAQAGEQLACVLLTESEGKTLLALTVVYPSKESRDATIASGMERGVAASYNNLAALLESSAAVVDFEAVPR
jgi:uncharacterized protein YndB with AHSA1/START domain